MQPVKIRTYQPDDLENVVELWYRTWHQTFPHIQHPSPYDEWKARFQDDFAVNGEILLAEIENKIVGFVVVIKEKHWLSQLFIDKNYQNQGIGSELLNRAKSICPQGLTLLTLEQNMIARKFYERHGFKVIKLSMNTIINQPVVEYYWQPSDQ